MVIKKIRFYLTRHQYLNELLVIEAQNLLLHVIMEENGDDALKDRFMFFSNP